MMSDKLKEIIFIQYWTQVPSIGHKAQNQNSNRAFPKQLVEMQSISSSLPTSVLLHSGRVDDVNELRLITRSTNSYIDAKQDINHNQNNAGKITFKEAPPTKNPSTSGCAANSLQFPPFTEPAFNMW